MPMIQKKNIHLWIHFNNSNMRKVLLLAALITVSMQSVLAKSPYEFGVKVGGLVNFSKLTTNLTGVNNFDDNSSQVGFELGFHNRINLPLGFMIQPELVYTRTNGKFDNANGELLQVRSNFIEVPALLGWRVGLFRIMAGPTFRFNIDDVLTSERQQSKIAPQLETFVMGYQAGLGVDLGRLTIDARYCGNFTNELDQDQIYGNAHQTVKYNASKIAISVGYMIFR